MSKQGVPVKPTSVRREEVDIFVGDMTFLPGETNFSTEPNIVFTIIRIPEDGSYIFSRSDKDKDEKPIIHILDDDIHLSDGDFREFSARFFTEPADRLLLPDGSVYDMSNDDPRYDSDGYGGYRFLKHRMMFIVINDWLSDEF